MKNKSSSIPVAMLVKKFYCHCCGNRLVKNPRTRTVRRGDPDYKEHSRIGDMHMIGDVEVTEYDFKCPHCGKIISYDEQCIFSIIQKALGKHILSENEISALTAEASTELKRKRRITEITVKIVFILLAALFIYICIR